MQVVLLENASQEMYRGKDTGYQAKIAHLAIAEEEEMVVTRQPHAYVT
jgi:hypothetical protein